MRFISVLIATVVLAVLLACGFAAAVGACDLPSSYTAGDGELSRVTKQLKERHRLDISVVGTGSSTLSGPDGANFAYPSRLEAALRQGLPGNEIKVTAHVKPRQTAAEMAGAMKDILAVDKPALVVWQTGTSDTVNGVEPDDFSASLVTGVEQIAASDADAVLMDMQYNPRLDSMLNVAAYADVMRWVAQEHGALLFDRLGIMRYWYEHGTFDLYAATKKYDMARKVHDCIGRALASQIINNTHLTP